MGGSVEEASLPTLYTDTFNELFPYYLSIGMSYDQFWNDDPWLAKAYREADLLSRKRRNEELWLQGLYIYEALCCVAPVLNPMAKAGTTIRPYAQRPYPITREDMEEERVRKEEERLALLKAKFQVQRDLVNLKRGGGKSE